MKIKILSAALLFLVCSNAIAYQHNIIPKPQQITFSDGVYIINSRSTIGFDASNEKLLNIATYFNNILSRSSGYTLKFSSSGSLNLRLDTKTDVPAEGYMLTVNKRGVTITAKSEAGIFYGIQTLLQLMPPDVRSIKKIEKTTFELPQCSIKDYPAFPWRGLMLDVSRHWFSVEDVKRYIDQLVQYKLNVFHWHLTDDQGWRIEIKSRPELTTKGALRALRFGKWWTMEPQQPDEKPTYGGFYTQQQIREIIAYAKARFVRVIPEIDVPGHSMAALVAYPELACMNPPKAVNVGNKFYGVEENSLCIGNLETMQFMDDVIREVAELFPDQYIHVGGDECYKGFWEKCPKCKLLMKEKNIQNVNQLQSYFIRAMQALLKKYGKRLIGWDEIGEGGLAPEATVMSWRGMQGGVDAAKAGHHVIMTPNNHCYLDLYQGDPAVEPDTYSMCRLRDSYAFEPVPDGVKTEMILGGQGNLWTESVPDMPHAEYMTWPRGWALAEILWSGTKDKDWNDFVRRTENHFIRADYARINYARSMYDAIITPFQNAANEVFVAIETEIPNLQIYYTLDGSDPSPSSTSYNKPIEITDDSGMLKVVTYRNGKQIGKVIPHSLQQLINASKGTKREVGNLNL